MSVRVAKDEVSLETKGPSRGTTEPVSGRTAAAILLHTKAPAGKELAEG